MTCQDFIITLSGAGEISLEDILSLPVIVTQALPCWRTAMVYYLASLPDSVRPLQIKRQAESS